MAFRPPTVEPISIHTLRVEGDESPLVPVVV